MPEGTQDCCFCQMCGNVKSKRLIEVNNIDIEPKYYFPQLRVVLCLECSKRFEYKRKNERIRKEYLAFIRNTEIGDQGTVDIPIDPEEDGNKIRFTATHLAEIQEILRQMPA